MDSQQSLYIGLMSGTSMDGIDAALLRIDAEGFELLQTNSLAWSEQVTQDLRSVAGGASINMRDLGHLDALVAEHFAAATLQLLSRAKIKPGQVRAIGSHGQTIFHAPDSDIPFTMQLGDPNRIAQRTGITTVADFRRRDMAAGGQGAPLAPAFHLDAFGKLDRVAILNIGGIANLTLLSGNRPESTFGFDTGPGNCLMDNWTRRHRNQAFDARGAWAAEGTVDAALLSRLRADRYFSQSPPKSTGPEYFSPQWLDQVLAQQGTISPQDVQATLLQLSAGSIADALHHYSPGVTRVLVCGGGVHNDQLMTRLGELLAPLPVESTEAHGIHPDWVEAAAFAWLAHQTLQGRAGNLPSVTGASAPVVLGGIYPGQINDDDHPEKT